jgi:hypothetical protein
MSVMPALLTVPAVVPREVQALNGHVAVVAEPGVQVKTSEFEGLTEVPASAVPGVTAGLGFRLAPTKPGGVPPWRLVVTVEPVDAWRRAELVHWLTVGEGVLQGRTVVQFEVQNAPTREFGLRVPGTMRSVEVTGPGLRRWDRDGDRLRLEVQHKVMGMQRFVVTWEEPFATEAGGPESALGWKGIEALDTERETGYVAVGTRTQLELGLRPTGTDLMRLDTQDLPPWAGQPEGDLVMVWRYLRPGFDLTLSARRFVSAGMLQALITEARLTTVVAEDGQMMTELGLAVRNNGRQFLAVTLPPRSELWAALVSGQPVQPGRAGDQLLVPLERSLESEVPALVQVTYVTEGPFAARGGFMELVSPAVDLPLKNARWELYLPTGYGYDHFGGSMSHEQGAARILGAFSLAEYSQAESQQRRNLREQFSNSVLDARNKLASGRVEDAGKALGMARGYGLSTELRQLEEEFSRVQSSNLQRAQQEIQASEGVGSRVGFDATAAEEQWAKLRQAQDLGAAQARPFRVNLPTRGVRYAFSQALQTQTGQPLTIRFEARSESSPSWGTRLGMAVAGFLALWWATAWGLRAASGCRSREGYLAAS